MAALSVSGYLPGEDRNGVGRMADQLAAGFDAAYDTGELEPRIVVVGILHPVSCKHKRNDDGDATHTVEVRFSEIEVVDGPEGDQVRAMIDRLRRTRTGVQTLPYPEDSDVVDHGLGHDAGHDLPPMRVAEPDRPKRGKSKGLSAVPDPFEPTQGVDLPGDYDTPDDPPEPD